MSQRVSFDFKVALNILQNCSMPVRRESWHGDAFLFLNKGSERCYYNFNMPHHWGDDMPRMNFITEFRLSPFLCLRTASGTFAPWSASSVDLLANDWSVVE